MLVEDPVCEMQFEEEEAFATLEFGGKVYFFCSETCRKSFEEEPERFAEALLELPENTGHLLSAGPGK
jgi:YHS domain-containing protein